MSPKSKGRPKGRGRTPTRRTHAPRTLSAVDHALREARGLEGPGVDPLERSVVASAWLGGAWAARSMGASDPEDEFVTQLVQRAERSGARPAYVALKALHTIAREPWGERVVQALADANDEVSHPEPPTPERVQLWSDPWGSETVHLLRYAAPSRHVVLVPISTVGGTMVQSIVVERDAAPDAEIGALRLRGDVDVDTALATIADAMWQTDMYWPPQDDPDFVVNRAYLHWLTEGRRAETDWDALPDDERTELIEGFRAEHGVELTLDPSTVDLLADTFVDFGAGYLPGGVLAWSPGEVERFLLDWIQRKVILEPEDSAAVPSVLRAWVQFALQRKGLSNTDIEPVVAMVDELTEDYLAAVDDGPRGPAGELMARAMAQGIDLNDQDALGRLVAEYNAEQNARRLLDS